MEKLTEPSHESKTPVSQLDLRKTRRIKAPEMSPPHGDQLPPHSIAAERGSLGCVLRAPTTAKAKEMLEELRSNDFYDVRHRELFTAFHCLAADGKPADVWLVDQWLRDKNRLESAGGIAYLQELPDSTPSPENFSYFLEILKEKARRRAALSLSTRLAGFARDEAIDPAALVQDARDSFDAIITAAGTSARKLTLRSPNEILAMQFDDSDIIIGDRLLAIGQSFVMAGQGGIGKSRLLLQLLASVITKRKFLTLDTGGSDLRWLILQTENTNRRLQPDLARLKSWLADDWQRFNAQVTIHTLENDTDGFVSLDSPENQTAVEHAISDATPDGIVIDPLTDFGIGDLSKDADMRATLHTLSRLCRSGNPHRVIVVLHHALTGKGGAVKAVGYDRASFGRNSKVLFMWTRGQINLAAVDEHNNGRLVVACGKCSNGKEFLPFAIRLNPDTFIYECDPTVDVSHWAKDISGQTDRGPLMSPERVAELCHPLSTKADLAKTIMADCGCYRTGAYRYITRATGRTIKHNKSSDTYSRK